MRFRKWLSATDDSSSARGKARRRFSPHFERLDERVAPATDIRLTALTTNGHDMLTINYTIVDEDAPAFDVGFFQSTNGSFGGDTLLTSVTIDDSADLTVGDHAKTYILGDDVGQVPLPGAGALDPLVDYFLLAVADFTDAVVEQDATPFAEDNTRIFAGVYHLDGGAVVVHTGNLADSITVADGANDLSVNGTLFTFDDATVAAYHIRTHGRGDVVSGINSSKPLFVWGGSGGDTLTGGTAGDHLEGGASGDVLSGRSGKDYLDGGAGVNTLTGGGSGDTWVFIGTTSDDIIQISLTTKIGTRKVGTATRQQDTFTDLAGSADSILVMAGAGNDTVTITGAIRSEIHGDLGNDTLTGGSLADLINGDAGNDKIFGGAGPDSLDGGADNDVVDGGLDNDTITGSLGTDTIKPGSQTNTLLLQAVVPAAGTIPISLTLTLKLNHFDGFSSGSGKATVSFTGTLDSLGNISGTFTGSGSGSGQAPGFSVNFTVSASGTASGSLSDGVDYDGSFTGNASGTDNGVPFNESIGGTFSGTINMQTGIISAVALVTDDGILSVSGNGFIKSIKTVAT